MNAEANGNSLLKLIIDLNKLTVQRLYFSLLPRTVPTIYRLRFWLC